VQANLLSIAQLFEGRLLRVPDYQRGYSWEEPQLRDFLSDLELLGAKQVHYTGTVVLHRTAHSEPQMDEGGSTHQTFDVVDGQQRLTTIVMLLCQLRRELQKLGGDSTLPEGIRRSFLWVSALGTKARLPKLSLAGDLGHFFECQVLADSGSTASPATSSEERIENARVYLEGYCAGQASKLGAEYPAWLIDLYAKVSQRLRTSLFPVESEAEVGVIFEVLNNRGKPLSDLEKVKNYLLYIAAKVDESGRLATRVNTVWGHVLRNLMLGRLTRSEHEDQLLRVHWLLAYDSNERKWDGSRSIKAKLALRSDSASELYAAVDDYLLTLESVAEAFADIETPTRDGAFRGASTDEAQRQEIILWVERLHRVGFVAPFRPLLAAARRAPNPTGLLRVLEACERFSFLVYRVAGVRTNAGRNWLHRLGHEVFHGRVDLETAATRVLGAIGWYIKTRAAYDRFFELDPDSPRSFYEWGGIRYFLYEREIALAGSRQVRLSWRQLHAKQPKTTIEHVLPQTPDDPYWDTFDAAARRLYTHDLGNLCLTEDNSSYGNKPFPAKRGEAGSLSRCYATSNLFSERALARATEWTPETVLARRAELVAWAKQRWPWSAAEGADVEAIAEEAETEEGA